MSIKNIGKMKITLFRIKQNEVLREKVSCLKGIKTVLDAGSDQLQQDKEGKLYKDYFPLAQYYTLNKDRGDNSSNHFNIDMHDLSSINKKFDLVMCLSVLEHVRNPFVVSNQIERVSNKYLFITTPFIFPCHNKNNFYKDYWRFTDNGLRELFSDFEEVWIEKMGSVIEVVRDKKKYKIWDKHNCSTGYAALFKRK